MDSVVDIRKAGTVPRSPGRGLTTDGKLHFLAALPRIDGQEGADDLTEGVAGLVERVSGCWSGPSAPPVRTLPLGLDETTPSPVWHDFSRTPHLIAVGDTESGKANLLRLVASAVTAR